MHVSKSVDSTLWERERKKWNAEKQEKGECEWSKLVQMLFSETEGPNTFWEQCLLVFAKGSKRIQDVGAFSDEVYSLDNVLHQSAKEGNLVRIRVLFETSYFTNKRNGVWKKEFLSRPGNDGNTPLHYAFKNEHIAVAQELLKQGADWNAENNARESPYHIACEKKLITELYKDQSVPKYDALSTRDKKSKSGK